MIIDAENLLLDKVSAVGAITSNVIANGAGGGAANPMCLYVGVTGGNAGGSLKVTLETSDVESFAPAKILAVYETVPLKARLTSGLKKFVRIRVDSTFTAGKITAALVSETDILGLRYE